MGSEPSLLALATLGMVIRAAPVCYCYAIATNLKEVGVVSGTQVPTARMLALPQHPKEPPAVARSALGTLRLVRLILVSQKKERKKERKELRRN